jgi:Saxitoxin biosynthesis operon protein SxtJ
VTQIAARSRRELRKFGLTVGGVFLLLGLVSWYRGHVVPPRVLWTLGTLLVVPGLVAPALLAPVEHWWMRMAAVLGHANTRIILSVLYFVVFTPFGAVMRLFRDPLDRTVDDGRRSNWIKRPPEPAERARYQQQF